MCPSPHNIGPNPPNMVKHSALSIVPTEYIEKIHQLLLLIFLRPRNVTGNLGSECKYRVLGPDYSINPPEYKSFKAFCEPFDLSLSYVKTSCQLPLQHLVPLRYPRMSAKSPFWPTVGPGHSEVLLCSQICQYSRVFQKGDNPLLEQLRRKMTNTFPFSRQSCLMRGLPFVTRHMSHGTSLRLLFKDCFL